MFKGEISPEDRREDRVDGPPDTEVGEAGGHIRKRVLQIIEDLKESEKSESGDLNKLDPESLSEEDLKKFQKFRKIIYKLLRLETFDNKKNEFDLTDIKGDYESLQEDLNIDTKPGDKIGEQGFRKEEDKETSSLISWISNQITPLSEIFQTGCDWGELEEEYQDFSKDKITNLKEKLDINISLESNEQT